MKTFILIWFEFELLNPNLIRIWEICNPNLIIIGLKKNLIIIGFKKHFLSYYDLDLKDLIQIWIELEKF